MVEDVLCLTMSFKLVENYLNTHYLNYLNTHYLNIHYFFEDRGSLCL